MSTIQIQGYCDSRFDAVWQAFEHNFASAGDKGAAFSAYCEGEKVVDIWAGTRDRHQELAWQEDTLVNVFSAGKGVLAMAALQLIEDGLLELDAKVTDYWPDYGCNGKQATTVAHCLSHRAGIPAIRQTIDPDAVYEWDRMAEVVANEEPSWQPGTAQGYHVFTFGWLVGELVKRVSGMSVSQYVAGKLMPKIEGDFYFGVPDERLSDVADVALSSFVAEPAIDADMTSKNVDKVTSQADDIAARAFSYPPTLFSGSNKRVWRQADIPAGNGHCDARSLAQLYGVLANGGASKDIRLLSSKSVVMCSKPLSNETDRVFGKPIKFSAGFMLNTPGMFEFGGKHSFGHLGSGGSVGFADPEKAVGSAYVTNQLMLGDRRAANLSGALLGCL